MFIYLFIYFSGFDTKTQLSPIFYTTFKDFIFIYLFFLGMTQKLKKVSFFINFSQHPNRQKSEHHSCPFKYIHTYSSNNNLPRNAGGGSICCGREFSNGCNLAHFWALVSDQTVVVNSGSKIKGRFRVVCGVGCTESGWAWSCEYGGRHNWHGGFHGMKLSQNQSHTHKSGLSDRFKLGHVGLYALGWRQPLIILHGMWIMWISINDFLKTNVIT